METKHAISPCTKYLGSRKNRLVSRTTSHAVVMRPTTLLFFGSLVIVHGHFLLTYPPTIGFDNDNEGEAPCGGFPDIFNNLTAPSMNITVAGFPIELQSTHPQAAWLFRATLSHEAPFNWTNLLPVVSETGIGDFCVPDLGAPVEFAGHAGILQVVQEEEGELLYQVRDLYLLKVQD